MQGSKNYQEKLFLNFQLSDRVPKDNFYRRLKELLDLSFVRKQTIAYYGKEGQKSIDPEAFFKLMLIGYIENLNSDRKIVENASMRMDYDRMHERTTSIKEKRMKTLRSATIEPVLATLLCFVGMRKVYTKGIDLANKHVLMAAMAYNIKNLLRFNSTNSIAYIAKFAATELINVFFQSYILLLRLLKQFSSTKSRVSILPDYYSFKSQIF